MADSVESLIRSIASEFFGKEVEMEDNFFSLGGSSVSALAFSCRIRDAFNLRSDADAQRLLGEVLSARNFGQLAERIRRRSSDGAHLPVAGDSGPDEESVADMVASLHATATSERTQPTAQQFLHLKRNLQRASVGLPRRPFTIYVLLDFSGEICASVLEEAARDVVSRHDGLRTRFGYDQDGVPVVLDRDAPIVTPLVTVLDAPESSELAIQYLQMIADASFGLTDVKLSIGMAECNGSGRTFIMIKSDHLVCDSSSMNLILDDLGKAYSARLCGREPEWSPVSSFAAWTAEQHDLYSAEGVSRRIRYWRDVLDPLEAYPEIRLPGMREPTNGVVTGVNIALPADSIDTLSRCFADSGVSFYSGMAAVLLVAIASAARLTVVGLMSPLGLRPEGWITTVGWFAQVTPIRARVDRRSTLAAVARVVMSRVGEAVQFNLPHALRSAILQPDRLARDGWHPRVYFDVTSRDEKPQLALGDLSGHYIDADDYVLTGHGVGIWLEPAVEGMRLIFRYQADAWPAAEAERFIHYYAKMLSDAGANWNERILDWAELP